MLCLFLPEDPIELLVENLKDVPVVLSWGHPPVAALHEVFVPGVLSLWEQEYVVEAVWLPVHVVDSPHSTTPQVDLDITWF